METEVNHNVYELYTSGMNLVSLVRYDNRVCHIRRKIGQTALQRAQEALSGPTLEWKKLSSRKGVVVKPLGVKISNLVTTTQCMYEGSS
jgi:invasion protein IalB